MAPVGLPFCRRPIVPLSVRASHTVFALVMLLKSTELSRLRFAEVHGLEHAQVHHGPRVEPRRAQRLHVDRAAAADRLRHRDLPRERRAALRVEVAGQPDVVDGVR